MSAKNKKIKRGDRKDAVLVRNLDSMHLFMPYNLPRRCDNEALANITVETSAVNAYIEKRNAENPQFKYTLFHVITAAVFKTIYFRPLMNRFISGGRIYERRDISASFVAKNKFEDNAHEALVIMAANRESETGIVDQVHDYIVKKVYSIRHEGVQDSTSDQLDTLVKLPRPILKFVVHCLRRLEYYGKYPASLMKDDPYYSTVFISNLGSIKLNASYHHLAEWGTNSLFAIIGEKHLAPVPDADGKGFTPKEVVDISLTIDERIADGVYFGKSLNLLKYLLANPELLDRPISEYPEGYNA